MCFIYFSNDVLKNVFVLIKYQYKTNVVTTIHTVNGDVPLKVQFSFDVYSNSRDVGTSPCVPDHYNNNVSYRYNHHP